MSDWWEQAPIAEETEEENWWETAPVVSEQQAAPTNEEPIEMGEEEAANLFGQPSTLTTPTTIPEDPEDKPKLLDQDVWSNPELMTPIRNYMVKRKGNQWADRAPEEVLDAYKTHMRTVSAGETSLIGEIASTYRYTPEEKAEALKAYETYENLAPMWEQGLGEGAEALWDYASAVINPLESPTTIISLGLGKAATSIFAKPIANQTIRTALKQGGKQAAQNVIKKQAFTNALKGAAAGAAFDAGAAGITDYAFQKEFEMELGARDAVDPKQTALAMGLNFALPTAIGTGLQLRAGKGVGMTPDEAKGIRRTYQRVSAKRAAPKLKESFGKLAANLSDEDWKNMAARGTGFDLKASQRQALDSAFFDLENPDSVVRILSDSGVKLNFEEGRFTNNLIAHIKEMPDDLRKPIEDDWKAITGTEFNDALDQVASIARESGEAMAERARAKQALESWMVKSIEEGKALDADDVPPQYMKYVQSTWKRLLVSNPATTAVNVQGWGIASGVRDASHMVQAAVTALYDPKQAANMVKAFKGKAKLMSDIFGTAEMFEDVMQKAAPAYVRDALSRETFGGVANKTPAELYGVGNGPIVRGTEAYAKWASKFTLVDAQDQLTRAFSGMAELDRQVTIKFGKSYSQLLKDGEEHLIDDKIWQRVVKTSLQDTFSFDYARSEGILRPFAQAVQSISNTPGLGFMFPFGKFMNNTVAFTIQHSVLGLPNLFRQAIKKDGYETTEALSKIVVGSAALYTFMEYSSEQIKDGFQWNQVENDAGEVRDVQNLAPASQFMLAGRIFDSIRNGDVPDKTLWEELGKQLVIGEFADIGNSEGVKLVRSMLNWLSSSEEGGDQARQEFAGQALKMMGNIGSGFTRPIDPINDTVGLATGNDTLTDRRMAETAGEQGFLQLTRYVDALLAPVLGEPEEPGDKPRLGVTARSISRPEGEIHDPNVAATTVGAKRSNPMRWLDKAAGMSNMAPFTLESRTAIPEFDRFVNGTLAPRADMAMKRLLGTDYFKKAEPSRRATMVKQTLSNLKEQLLNEMEEGLHGLDPLVADQRRLYSMKPAVERREAQEVFGFEGGPRKLSPAELNLLNHYLKLRKEQYGATIDALSK